MALLASEEEIGHHYQIPNDDGDIELDPLSLDGSPRCQHSLGVPCLGGIGRVREAEP